METAIHVMYMVASVLFIVGIKRLSAVGTARSANALSALAMLIAMVAALLAVSYFPGLSLWLPRDVLGLIK